LLLAGATILAGFVVSAIVVRSRPVAHHRQVEFIAEAQDSLTADIDREISTTFISTLDDFAGYAQAAAERLESWLGALDVAAHGLEEQLDALRADRDKRAQIRVRRYLEDDALLGELEQRFVNEAAIRSASDMIRWITLEQTEPVAGACPLAVRLDALNARPVTSFVTDDVLSSLNQAALVQASRARVMCVTDVLRDYYRPELLAAEAGERAQPFIDLYANEQSHSEYTQRLAGRWEDDRDSIAFARTCIALMAKPLASRVNQQEARLSQPHRCVALSTLDVLKPSGIVNWNKARQVYEELTAAVRSQQHVFNAEQCAVKHEVAISDLLKQKLTLSPYAASLHGDVRRLRTFCLTVALGWLVEGEQKRGATYLRYWQICLPGSSDGMVSLNRPEEFAPALFEAATTFVTTIPREMAEQIRIAVDDALDVRGDRDRMYQLEDQLRHISVKGVSGHRQFTSPVVESREQEVITLIKAYALDELRALDGATRKMAGAIGTEYVKPSQRTGE
jgi:hypothetical protein